MSRERSFRNGLPAWTEPLQRAGSLALGLSLSACAIAGTDDWPEWGGEPSKNMISSTTGLPRTLSAGEEKDDDTGNIDATTALNCRWVATLGSESYGTPTIANGRVLIGTNNENPRNPDILGDRGVTMCFEERTGRFQWQLASPKLPEGDDVDWEYLGICSSTLLAGDRGYVVTNRGEIACLDLTGLAGGNEGFSKEAAYLTADLEEPVTPGATDADLLWIYDMRSELGVTPHNISSSSVTLVDGLIIATTSNGVDGDHEELPSPDAPCLIALDAKTGALVGREASGIGARTLHCNWSSPCIGKVGGKNTIFFGGGDGFLYAFSPSATKDDRGVAVLPELWRYDANPPEYRQDENGQARKYGSYKGPSEIVGTPVFARGRVYVAIGQDPESGDGLGMLSCVDAKTGKPVWTYKDVSRSLSTPAVTEDGLLYLCDYAGRIHCLDAATGTVHWVHDTLSRIWGSTLVADGRVFVGTEDGELIILKDGKNLEELAVVEFPAPLYSSPVAANGTLYLQTQTHLYAFGK